MQITSKDIETMIEIELSSDSEFNNSHGIDSKNISGFLVQPRKEKFINPANDGIEEFWIVLDECYNDKEKGYLVIYSEKDEMFGLATKGSSIKGKEDFGAFLGLYGSFKDALESM